MQAGGTLWTQARGRVAVGLAVLALLLRMMIPAGFMPAAGQGFAITLCTGEGASAAWIDGQGTLRKGKPPMHKGDQPCAFAGFAAALDLPDPLLDVPALLTPFLLPAAVPLIVAIGRGLAAPPPPPTGPPAAR